MISETRRKMDDEGMRKSEREEVAVRVRDLMSRSLVSIDADDTVTEAARLMDRKRIHSILIQRGREFSGIITDLDIVSRVVSKGLDPSKVKVSQVMTSPLVSIREDTTIEEAARKMRENGVRRLVVESDDNKVGIIAESDIVRITPELHFLIRERSKLEAGLTEARPQQVVLSGYCEMCGNYSSQLRNADSRWLCTECGGR
jgi:signal-transduction protein with cAMP-binding, CBS, and nucleotidyltransferase domain